MRDNILILVEGSILLSNKGPCLPAGQCRGSACFEKQGDLNLKDEGRKKKKEGEACF